MQEALVATLAMLVIILFVIRARASRPNDGTRVSPPQSPPPIREEIVICSNCSQRNRLQEMEAPSRYRCGSCHSDLPNPFLAQAEPIPTFRPTSSRSSNGIGVSFRGVSSDGDSVAARNLSGLVDAFTGEALNSALGLYQCGKCEVYYHGSSFEVIQSENAGRCVACLSISVRAVTTAAPRANSWQNVNFEPDVITSDNYRDHVGRVITFEGIVRKVLKSRSGRDYAAMFEDKDWSDGLKMVILRGKITAVGGGDFIRGLKGRTIRVRGLLQKHPLFGYQIAVSERRMIQL